MKMTYRQELSYKWWSFRVETRRWWQEKLPLWIARHLPKQWLYWAVVLGACRAWAKANKSPDEISISEMLHHLDWREYPKRENS
jgi:hypothetical protein